MPLDDAFCDAATDPEASTSTTIAAATQNALIHDRDAGRSRNPGRFVGIGTGLRTHHWTSPFFITTMETRPSISSSRTKRTETRFASDRPENVSSNGSTAGFCDAANVQKRS